MRRTVVSFAVSGNIAGARARWLRPIESAWPTDAVPDVQPVGIDPLLATLQTTGPASGTLPSAIVLVFGPGEPARTIDRAIESLGTANIPALCLMEDPGQWRRFQRHGVLFEQWDSDPKVLAAMLYALTERQSAVELLAQEMVLSQRCQGGIRLEMERIHEELHLAASIQREFTSAPLPKIAGLDFGVLFRPVNFVSGDIYNVRPLGDRAVAFFLADAVGHGVPAALLTMVLTSSLTTTESIPGEVSRVLEPSDVLGRLNRRLCESCLGTGRFATALYGVIDGTTREVRLAGAGHPWPLVVSRRQVREVATDGPLLGVFSEADFDQAVFTLEPDETLLLYTDGFESMFPDPEQAPGAKRQRRRGHIDHLSKLVRERERGDFGTTLADLGFLLDEQAGSLHQADDITALLIAPAPQAVPAHASLAAA
jgi:sigma-B regulation protein RsbU (phosphoserine phosphatase)